MMQKILLIFFVFQKDVLGKIIIGPQHAESTVGGKVILNCITDYTSVSDPLEWRYKPETTVLFEPIYTSGYIVNGFYDRYTVKGDHTKGEYNLVIYNVSFNDAGIYTCADMEGDTKRAELVVFMVFPSVNSCRIEAPSDGIIGNNSCGFPPDTVRLSCNMNYRGNIVPMMQWRELEGSVIAEGVYNEVVNGSSVSTLVLKGNQIHGRKYTCSIVYTDPTFQSNYSWIATATTLQIEDVRKATTVGSDQEILNCSIGSMQNCTYKWIDDSNNSESSPTLYLKNKPSGRYRCISECDVRGRSCSTVYLIVDHQCSPNGAQNLIVVTATVIVVVLIAILISVLLFWRVRGRRRKKYSRYEIERHDNSLNDLAEPDKGKEEPERHLLENATENGRQDNDKHEYESLFETTTDIAMSEQIIDKSNPTPEKVAGFKSSDPASAYYMFRQQMKDLVKAEFTYMLRDETYSKIQKTIERPRIEENEINQFWRAAFPYIIQRIKMWNGYVLTDQNIADLVIRKLKNPNKHRPPTIGSQISANSGETIKEMKTGGISLYPVSRLDFTTYLINVADCIVAHDILRIMSKFPMAIPLIVQDIHEDDTFILTVPIIQNIQIKWESTPGQIVENHLFSSPFRMVAAIRLGTNKIGKSTILNQLMSKPFLFSSQGEAGRRYGRPSTLDGAVEIIWLTQATCSSPTWKTAMSDYYKQNTEEVMILANLHGGALQHAETLQYLERHVCSFIVFLMPDCNEQEWAQLRDCIKCENIVRVLVDPPEDVDDENDTNTIRTESLSSDDTLDTMRCLLKESLNYNTKAPQPRMEGNDQSYKSLRFAVSLNCNKTEEIVAVVKRIGCFDTKRLLSSVYFKDFPEWDSTLKRLIKLTLDILSLPTNDAKKHLAHLETKLSQISAKESVVARAEVSEANKMLRRILKVPIKTGNSGNSENSQMEEDLKKSKQALDEAMNKFDNMNLGQEHLFRTLGHMYENSLGVTDLGDFTTVRDLPNQFADLLINGHAIEMLNGDSGKIQLIWIKAICDSVLKKFPRLKIFVISIIGLQSSGKSTLLNALFSCRFAVSVGRCSRGLFMRMIFLDETLRHSHGCNAILLIDTEGLSSPEKMNDPKANQKDRLMATFAMGISNLTIVNILGEGMTEMTEILQIAVVAMARLRVGGIKPDILMVQHLQERNLSKMDQSKGQFCEALNKAFELISKNDVEIGTASAECLDELIVRIHSGDLFQHFGPFKDGSSVNSPPSESYHDDVVILMETVLKRTEVSENKSLFERWCNHFESYWACVQEENFALNFRNVKHITDFLYFEKKIAKVKELLDRTIRCHREIFSGDIRRKVNSQIAGKRKTDSTQHRKRLLEVIEGQLNLIPIACPTNCDGCLQFNESHAALLEELSNTEWMEDTKRSLEKYNTRLREITLKMLGQTFDGSLVRQCCFSEFSDKIETELKKALLKRPSGIYEPEEQEEIIKDIWGYLQDIARKMEGGPNLETKFTEILLREYSGIFPTFLKDFEKEITIDHLATSIAIKSFWDMNLKSKWEFVKKLNYTHKLSEDQMSNLMSAIYHLINTVFRNRCVDFCKTGLDFEEGMVSHIRSEFPEEIQRFEDRFCMKLHDNFKIRLQMYALQQFKKKIMELQKLWDNQNKPTEILKQKRLDYITEIETRLKSGFSSAGEGQVVAAKLYNAMKKNATQAGYEEKVQLIKNMSWTTNSEKVRLCYFEELAEEVQAGQKERALRHFNNPKNEIEKWYKKRVDSFDTKDKVLKVYESTLQTELNLLTRKISNCATKVEIKQIVEEHIIKAGDDQYYSQLVPKEFDFGVFKDSITHELTSSYKLHDRKYIVFPLSSYDSEIMNRLGCTEHCYWCGALCWGSRVHQLGKDRLSEMEAHHSCHQPSGLKGVANRHTKKLSSTACHSRTDGWRVWFGEYQDDEGMLWSQAKLNHFNDWKFDVHHIKRFDELMRWFFQELHHDIAQRRNMLPADETDLKENKCENLEFQDILNYVRHKI